MCTGNSNWDSKTQFFWPWSPTKNPPNLNLISNSTKPSLLLYDYCSIANSTFKQRKQSNDVVHCFNAFFIWVLLLKLVSINGKFTSAFLKCINLHLKCADVSANMKKTDYGNLFSGCGNVKTLCLRKQFGMETNNTCNVMGCFTNWNTSPFLVMAISQRLFHTFCGFVWAWLWKLWWYQVGREGRDNLLVNGAGTFNKKYLCIIFSF